MKEFFKVPPLFGGMHIYSTSLYDGIKRDWLSNRYPNFRLFWSFGYPLMTIRYGLDYLQFWHAINFKSLKL